jgi:pimeloyl-ACP methyl ester carboxylesterase
LRPKLLLIRGADDPGAPPEYEIEIHQAVPGSRYLKLQGAGHFPMAEKPEEVNRAIEEFLKMLP